MRLAFPGALAALDNNEVLVTSSRTLAEVAKQEFARSRMRSGLQSWQRPDVYTLEAWLTSVWQEARYSQPGVLTLLSPAQEHFLWQQIIAAQSPGLLDSNSIARLARRAADLVAQHSISLDDAAWQEQEDAEQFLSWFAAFRLLCAENGWMTRREILMRLTPHNRPVFIGFDEAPGRGALLRLELAARKARLSLAECEGLPAEMEVAARWARTCFEGDPGQSIAVFVPELRTHRARIERIFRSVFYPGHALILDPGPLDAVFHVNAPQPLTDHPLISAALLLLELVRPRLAQSDGAAIVRSPFLRAAREERELRAKADLLLRRTRELEVSLRDLEKVSRDCPRLQQVWKQVRGVLDRRADEADFARWARFFSDLLSATGWPGDMDLTAEEQHAVEMWKDALSSLSALGMVSPAVSFEAAVAQLKRLLAIGGAETGDWSSPIQILDSADAPGLLCDAAFLVGLGDETWPPIEPVSPLVPLRLQRAHGVPMADVSEVRKRGVEWTRALVNVASVIAGSYSERLAPQVRNCAKVGRFDADIWNGQRPIESFAPVALEEYREKTGPAYNATAEARGGTGIIKDQSRCPFRAFAARRLGARLPDDASFGFDALDRGTFLHSALQHVWAQLKTQKALKATPEDQLRELVEEAVEKAVGQDENSLFYEQASRVERERLEGLVFTWLTTVERDRSVPFTVESAEEELHFELAGLSLRVRMDRVDRLPNGGLVLIDYKSGGNINKNRLIGDRPAEPQLLVYAAAKGNEVEGVLFGFVAPRDLRWNGFTAAKMTSQRTVEVCKDWDGFLSSACESVAALAAEFVRGEAVITPSSSSCAYCDLPALCRKREQQSVSEEAE